VVVVEQQCLDNERLLMGYLELGSVGDGGLRERQRGEWISSLVKEKRGGG